MKITFAKNIEELEALSTAWRHLETQVENVLPFQTFAWTKAWWQVFSVRNFIRKDELLVVAYWENETLIAVIPRMITRYSVLSVNLYDYVRPIGADSNLTEIRVPLIHSQFQDSVIKHLLGTVNIFGDLRSLHQIIVPIQIQNKSMPSSGLYQQSMLNTMMIDTECLQRLFLLDKRRITNFVLNTDTSIEKFRRNLKRNIKESLRRCYNSLAKDGLKVELVVWDNSIDILNTLDTFCAMHSERAKQTGTVRHPDYFAKKKHRQFLNCLAENASGVGMRLFCLMVNEEAAAMRLGFVVNNELYMYYSGYWKRFAKYSVMTTLVNEMIAWAHIKGLAQVNLSIGRDVSKIRWGPREIIYSDCHYVRDMGSAIMVGRFMFWMKARFKKG